jgi:hypothetical protein
VLPLKNNEVPNGVVIGNTKFHKTLYEPAGIAPPDVNVTVVAAKTDSGIYPLNNCSSHADVPTLTVMLFIESLTPANGIQIL